MCHEHPHGCPTQPQTNIAAAETFHSSENRFQSVSRRTQPAFLIARLIMYAEQYSDEEERRHAPIQTITLCAAHQRKEQLAEFLFSVHIAQVGPPCLWGSGRQNTPPALSHSSLLSHSERRQMRWNIIQRATTVVFSFFFNASHAACCSSRVRRLRRASDSAANTSGWRTKLLHRALNHLHDVEALRVCRTSEWEHHL